MNCMAAVERLSVGRPIWPLRRMPFTFGADRKRVVGEIPSHDGGQTLQPGIEDSVRHGRQG